MVSSAGSLLLRRFGSVARTDGLGAALLKSSRFVGRRLMPHLPPGKGPEQRAADHLYLQPIWQSLAVEGAFGTVSAPALLRKRRQIALIGDLNLPQCRKYRVEQLAEFWRARGVPCEFAHYADVPRATRILQLATHLCEYRLPGTPVTEMLRFEARRLRLPVLYDIDDPLFSVSAYATYGNLAGLGPGQRQQFLEAAPGYLNMMNGADAVSLSTPGLMEEASGLTRRPLLLRRNFADRETLEAGARARSWRREDALFRFAFCSGSLGHEADLAPLLDQLTEVILARADRRLLILGHFDLNQLPKALRGRVERRPFTGYRDYLCALAQADCALVPLKDDPFNRCKSAVRVLDAAAVGVPAVVSAVGDLRAVVREGETGWIAHQEKDWADLLQRVAAQPDEASEAGMRARKNLERAWTAEGEARAVSEAFVDWIEG